MPDVRNCRRCGRVYTYIGGAPLCVDCRDEDEKNFRRVKEYLYENPGATLSEVSTVLDLSVERIKTYLRDGRLEIIGGEANLILECETCGKAIRTGRFCDECSRSLGSDFRSQVNKLKDSLARSTDNNRGVGMRYLTKEEEKKNK